MMRALVALYSLLVICITLVLIWVTPYFVIVGIMATFKSLQLWQILFGIVIFLFMVIFAIGPCSKYLTTRRW